MVVPYEEEERYHGNDGFNDVEFHWEPDVSKASREPAVDAIKRIVSDHPGMELELYCTLYTHATKMYLQFFFATLTFSALGEVTMVCLAPLTNLALALKTAPSVAADLKEVVLMGGNIEGVGNTSIAAEFNFHADPEAAFVVLDAARCPVVVVSWELCFKYIHIPMVSSTSAMFHPQLTTIADPTQLHLQEWRLEVLGKTGTKQAEMFNRLEQPWFDNYEFDPEIWILCDQLAVAVALDRTIVTASRHKKVARLLRVSPPWS